MKQVTSRNMFLRNVGWFSTVYTSLYPRKQNSSLFHMSLKYWVPPGLLRTLFSEYKTTLDKILVTLLLAIICRVYASGNVLHTCIQHFWHNLWYPVIAACLSLNLLS
jgi:hypothetical protein